MDLMQLRKFETLGPFEIKDELIKLAKQTSRTTQSAFLNAGRGNPNWIATEPREAFFLLGRCVTEQAGMEHPAGIGGMPQPQGIAGRFETWLAKHADMPGGSFLSAMVPFAIKRFGFEPDAFVHELVDSIIGDNYPVPDRMLVHNERIVHEYLMGQCGKPPASSICAVEGGRLCATSLNR
jgi:aspartate 4-decarboxylase